MSAPPARRSAKSRPLSGLLLCDGRRDEVVVTAHETRLVINVEANISAIPIARVRRDEGLNLRRTDNKDWRIRFDTLPPAESWVHDLPLLPPPNPLRQLAVILLALLALIGTALWAVGGDGVSLAPQSLPDLAKVLPRPVPQSWLV
ncbi:hypothetical protein [Sandarakinorhabdus limnophila]|uniref:hypothetical protein n=1 Tax=Sandarakinorhabdus limnophila TaxID=210512 RepID=UPI0026EF2B13|nr:hypothetical protein [Sandarakinorhabdus limnophila]